MENFNHKIRVIESGVTKTQAVYVSLLRKDLVVNQLQNAIVCCKYKITECTFDTLRFITPPTLTDWGCSFIVRFVEQNNSTEVYIYGSLVFGIDLFGIVKRKLYSLEPYL